MYVNLQNKTKVLIREKTKLVSPRIMFKCHKKRKYLKTWYLGVSNTKNEILNACLKSKDES